MTRVTTTMILLLAWTVCSVPTQAQQRNHSGAGVNLLWAIPQGDFANNVDDEGLGFMLYFGGQVPDRPFALITEFSFLRYGSDAALELARFEEIPVEALAVMTNNNMAMGHLVGRLQPASGAFRPYVDALVGARYFYTRTNIQGDFVLDLDDDFIDLGGNDISLASRFDDFALSYGVGAGVDLQLLTVPTKWSEGEARISLNVGARYLFGSEAEYVAESSLREENGRFAFDVDESRTDVLIPQFGIRVNH